MRLRDSGLALRELDGRTMMLDLASSTYIAVGGAGTAILDLLQSDDLTPDELTARLQERFAVDPARLRTDVDAFLRRLKTAGLLAQ